jgi:hypothetical protein
MEGVGEVQGGVAERQAMQRRLEVEDVALTAWWVMCMSEQ